MKPEHDTNLRDSKPVNAFTTTHWSVVLAAQQASAPERNIALERLCLTYWRPLYAYVRRRGYAIHDAQDLTQEFFARFLAKDFIGAVDRSKGRFRSFLLAAMEHFLASEWRRENAQKRGGGCTFVSFDVPADDSKFLQLPADNLTPEQTFDKHWAITVESLAMQRLKDWYYGQGKQEFFEIARVFLTTQKKSDLYPELAAQFGMKQKGFEVAIGRLRRRWGKMLREEVAKTVPLDEVEEELQALFQALCV